MTNGADYERGRREAALEGRMSALEARLDEQGRALGHLTGCVDKLEDCTAGLVASLAAREQVDQALKHAAETVSRRSINRREWWFGVAIIVLTLGLVVAGFLSAVGH